MSEGTGPGTTMTNAGEGKYKLGTVGKPFLGIELKIDTPNCVTTGEVWSISQSINIAYN